MTNPNYIHIFFSRLNNISIFQRANVIFLVIVCFFIISFLAKSSIYHFLIETTSFLLITFILHDQSHKASISTTISIFIFTVLNLLILYLLPLPTEVWLQLPGRSTYQEVITLLEQSNNPVKWHSLSLNTYASVQALLALLPPSAIFLSVLFLPLPKVYSLIWVFLILAALQGGIGIIQYTQTGYAHGFYANYNHYAALMGLALPLTIVSLTQASLLGRVQKLIFAGYGIATLLIFTGGFLSTSRAGTAGLFFGLFASIVIVSQKLKEKYRLPLIITIFTSIIVFIVCIMIFLPTRIATLSLWEDPRWPMFKQELIGILAFFPLGSGPGTFADTYAAFQPQDKIGWAFIQHAHNDYFELLFETGIIGIIIIAGFLYLFLKNLWSIWTQHLDSRLSTLKAGAAIGMLTALFHAFFEFNFHIVSYQLFFSLIIGVFFKQANSSQK